MSKSNPKPNSDKCAKAMTAIVKILEPLTPEERQRAIKAVEVLLELNQPIIYRTAGRAMK